MNVVEQQKLKLGIIRDLRVFLKRAQPRGEGEILEQEIHAWLKCKEFLDQTEGLTIKAIKEHNDKKEVRGPSTPKKAVPRKRKK